MKIYIVTTYYEYSTSKDIYTNEKYAIERAKVTHKDSQRPVYVDEYEPDEDFNLQFVKKRECFHIK